MRLQLYGTALRVAHLSSCKRLSGCGRHTISSWSLLFASSTLILCASCSHAALFTEAAPELADLSAGSAALLQGPGDAELNEPTFQVLDPETASLTASQPLAILKDTWPVSLYPALFVLPVTGSLAIIAGEPRPCPSKQLGFDLMLVQCGSSARPVRLPTPASEPGSLFWCICDALKRLSRREPGVAPYPGPTSGSCSSNAPLAH